MSEYFLAEVNKVYQQLGLPFEASWFPLFYILSNRQQVSIRQVADELMTSHSAVSQLVTKLKEMDLLETFALEEDKRVQVIRLTSTGKALKNKLLPVWAGISQSMALMEKAYPDVTHFLPAVAKLEAHFEAQPLSEIILEKVGKQRPQKRSSELKRRKGNKS